MLKLTHLVLIFSLWYFSLNVSLSYAQDIINDSSSEAHHVRGDVDACPRTMSFENDYEPAKFITSNNLLKHSGGEEIFCGEKILIYGKVVDKDCLPVKDTKIYLWQANCRGKYPYETMRSNLDKSLIDVTGASSFTGNGTAITNNRGEFLFWTIYPASVHAIAPHVNIRVESRGGSSLQTRFILSGKKISPPFREDILQEYQDFLLQNAVTSYKLEISLSK